MIIGVSGLAGTGDEGEDLCAATGVAAVVGAALGELKDQWPVFWTSETVQL